MRRRFTIKRGLDGVFNFALMGLRFLGRRFMLDDIDLISNFDVCVSPRKSTGRG